MREDHRRARDSLSLRHRAREVLRFFDTRVWAVRLGELRPGKAFVFRAARVFYSTVRGFRENGLTFRAAALTYFTILSVVPFLAVAFSVLKGFGAYRGFVDGTVYPYVRETFGGNPALLEGIQTVLRLVDETNVSGLGTVAMLFFVYTAISLMANVESTLNDIWGAKSKRPFLRQVTDYTTLLVTTPILMSVAITFATAAQSSQVVLFLRTNLGLGPVIDFFLRLTSLVVACMAMIALFVILPNVKSRLASVVLGGVVSGVLWQLALVLHVQFQMGVARYSALYSGFGAIPIFLVWTFVSWLSVLLGAQLAASHQNEQTVRQMLRDRQADQALKETLAIAVVAQVTRDFLDSCPRRTSAELAELLEVPALTMNTILETLVRAGVLAKTVTDQDLGYLPGRDLGEVRLEDIRDALRRDPGAAELKDSIERQLGAGLRELVQKTENERYTSSHNLTLRELAALAPGRRVSESREPVPTQSILDAKQPEVPA